MIGTDICLAAYAIYVIFVSIHYVHLYDYGGGRHSYDMPPEFMHGFFWVSLRHLQTSRSHLAWNVRRQYC